MDTSYIFFKYLREEHFDKDIGFIKDALSAIHTQVFISGFENSLPLSIQNDKSIKLIEGSFSDKNSKLKMIKFVFSLRKKTKKLILFHITRENLLLAFIFSFFNPNSKVLIKSDINIDRFLLNNKSFWKKSFITDWFFKLIAIYSINKVSSETKYGCTLIEEFFNDNLSVFHLPNSSKLNPILKKNIEHKEKRFLYVGRIGCPHKNVEFLLNELKFIDLGVWKFDFVGPIDLSIEPIIKQIKSLHGDNVNFLGPIYNKNELQSLFYKAKYFVLCSVSEGFPLVCVEALSSGCCVITSNIHAANDLTIENKFIFSSSKEFRTIFDEILNEESDFKHNYLSLSLYSNFERNKLQNILQNEF